MGMKVHELHAASTHAPLVLLPAAAVIDRMKRIVGRSWTNMVKKHGGTAGDCDAIARAFHYPGFEHTERL